MIANICERRASPQICVHMFVDSSKCAYVDVFFFFVHPSDSIASIFSVCLQSGPKYTYNLPLVAKVRFVPFRVRMHRYRLIAQHMCNNCNIIEWKRC